MRRWSAWAVAAFVALLLPLGVFGQDSTTGRMGWFTRLFQRNESEAEEKKTASDKPYVSPARQRAVEKRKWLRRLEVCDRLRQIASETGDEELARKADRLDERAWEIFSQRTGTAGLQPMSTSVDVDVDRIQEYLEKTRRQSAEASLRYEENREPRTAGRN